MFTNDLYPIKQYGFNPIIACFYFLLIKICILDKTGYPKWRRTGPNSADDSYDEDDKKAHQTLMIYIVMTHFLILKHEKGTSNVETVLAGPTKAEVAW
ncbi:hypothetical protein AVEN_184108-1 [Araneus ventricosus]|uniref:Uncharacterized protein n=1 Tax=Araneus ventricosus TaxID=182803 RepID=A0A4Y2CY85_ARAVE|nr:hypothetical protein AVEN_184108-1 [Araneus ventricosus]